MNNNRLKLNTDKTQVNWLGSTQQLMKVNTSDIHLQCGSVSCLSVVNSLGVLIYSNLSMSEHISNVCRLCFYQFRQIRGVRLWMTPPAVSTLIHAFIANVGYRVDYCNSLLYGIAEGLTQRLKRVQNMAARLVLGLRKYDQISGAIRGLRWLPVRQRIDYKVALLIYKYFHGLTQPYLARQCVPKIL